MISLVKIHINTERVNALGFTTVILEVCSLLYNATASLVIGPNLMEQGKAMVFSAGDGDESAFDPIIDKDKADPWLKSVKKEAKLLMQKLGPNCDKLNQIMRKEERVIALQKDIRDTYKHDVVM